MDHIMYALYIILGIAPFTFVRIYPFYDKLRVKARYFWCVFSAILALEVVWFIAIEHNQSALFVSDSESLRMAFYFVYLVLSILLANCKMKLQH